MKSYVVVCRGDRNLDESKGDFQLATRQTWTVKNEAEEYAKGISESRDPIVVEGDFNQLQYPLKNIRYVLTIRNKSGMRSLFYPCQGRYTYETREEAQGTCDAFLFAGELGKVYSPEQIASLRVDPCECWPGHNDPKGVWFDD